MTKTGTLKSFLNPLHSIAWLRSDRFYRVLIFVGSISVISLLFPIGGRFEYRYDLNEITKEAIIAPDNFPVLKSPETLESEREAARRAVPYLFRRDPQITTAQLEGVVDLFTRANGIQRAENRLAQSRQQAYRYEYRDIERFTEAQRAVERDSTEVVDLKSNFSQRFPLDLDLNAPNWSSFFRE